MAKNRVGVIGCRGIGVRHASGLVGLPNAELVAGCDILETTLADFKDQWKDHWSNIALYTDQPRDAGKGKFRYCNGGDLRPSARRSGGECRQRRREGDFL